VLANGDLSIRYTGTDDMVADFLTKKLTGEKFKQFRIELLGYVDLPANAKANRGLDVSAKGSVTGGSGDLTGCDDYVTGLL
jgi:hypothetical protein